MRPEWQQVVNDVLMRVVRAEHAPYACSARTPTSPSNRAFIA